MISLPTVFVVASHDGSTLERLYLVDSNVSAGSEGFSFVDSLYTNAFR